MFPLLVGFGRLDVVLVLFSTVPALISAQPVPMDEKRIEDLTNELLQKGLPGLVSRWYQHDRAPALALEPYHAANPNVYHQATHFGNPHSAFGMQGTDWSNDARVRDSMQEWENLLRPADRATAIDHQGASSSQWQPEDIASPSSNLALAPDPAHTYQAQASMAYQSSRPDGGQFREHLAGHTARNDRHTQRSVRGPQQRVIQRIPQEKKASELFPEIWPKFADLKVVDDDGNLFTDENPARVQGLYHFQRGTPAQQTWILNRYRQQGGRGGSWLDADVDYMESKLFSNVVGSVQTGRTRFNAVGGTPSLKPYIVGNHLIYFNKPQKQEKNPTELYVLAIPFFGRSKIPVTSEYTITVIGLLKIQPGSSQQSRASKQAWAPQNQSQGSKRRSKP